jgi:hypothetical protein
MATIPKKLDPNRQLPSRNKLIVGIVLILIGLVWGVYELNPGGALRAETEAEARERKDAAQLEKEKALAALRKRR